MTILNIIFFFWCLLSGTWAGTSCFKKAIDSHPNLIAIGFWIWTGGMCFIMTIATISLFILTQP